MHSSVNVLDIAGGGFGGGIGSATSGGFGNAGNTGSRSRGMSSGGSSSMDYNGDGEPKKNGAGYLMKRYFYHLFHGGPKKASQIYSNYRQGK